MRANGFEREDFLLTVVFGVHDPHAELRLVALFYLPRRKFIRRADAEPARWLTQNIGEHEPHGTECPSRCGCRKRREPNRERRHAKDKRAALRNLLLARLR